MGNLYNGCSSVCLPYFELLNHNAISGMVIIPDDSGYSSLFESEMPVQQCQSLLQGQDG
jgi:hypothetical protein